MASWVCGNRNIGMGTRRSTRARERIGERERQNGDEFILVRDETSLLETPFYLLLARLLEIS
jgi:hypothetical protein